jgi:dihydroxyacetone kinase
MKAVLISGLGATPVMELYIVYQSWSSFLTGISIIGLCGQLLYLLEMMSHSHHDEADAELKELIAAEATWSADAAQTFLNPKER